MTKRATVWLDRLVFRWAPQRFKSRQSLPLIDIGARRTALRSMFLMQFIYQRPSTVFIIVQVQTKCPRPLLR